MGCKRKADKVLRDSKQDMFFARVRMDIRHCLLSGEQIPPVHVFYVAVATTIDR